MYRRGSEVYLGMARNKKAFYAKQKLEREKRAHEEKLDREKRAHEEKLDRKNSFNISDHTPWHAVVNIINGGARPFSC